MVRPRRHDPVLVSVRATDGISADSKPAILEREWELSELAAAAREASAGLGGLVLILGEGGIGKSSLVQAVGGLLPAGGRLLVGHCDDLGTPRPLGPLRDLDGNVGTDLTQALRQADRDAVLAALPDELDRLGHPTVLAIEDVHWADDATLDIVRYLSRRIANLPAVLVLTYDEAELTREHPLHQVLAQAAASGRVRRLPLRQLSADAVRRLSASSPLDAENVFAMTSGNPFFVAEMLANGDSDRVPSTIIDSVQGRLHRLDALTQGALEQLAVVPSTVDRWLVEAVVPDGLAALAAAEEHGLLDVSASSVAFRHELARRVIAGSVPVARRVGLHRRVLRVLVAREGVDPSRIVHHAAQAGDAEAIVRHGPGAARKAVSVGAHREAAALYQLVLQHRERFAAPEIAQLHEEYAIECHTIGSSDAALTAQHAATELRRSMGDPGPLGADLCWLSRMYWWAGNRTAAEQAAAEAIAVLEPADDKQLLALALSNQSRLHMLAHRPTDSVRVGERAIVLARGAGDAAALSDALTNVGTAWWQLGDDEAGYAMLEESLRLALAAGDSEHACRSYVNLIWNQLDDLRLDDAEEKLAAGMSLAESSGHFGYLGDLSVALGRLKLARACWVDAVRAAQRGLIDIPYQQCTALTVLGRVAMRRGEPEGEDLLRRAWVLAVDLDELQRTGPVAAARAEGAWLAGAHDAVRLIAGPALDDARRLGHTALQAELSFWLTRVGQAVAPIESEQPYALQAAGRWREAAASWQAVGCPYEYAAALAESPDPQDRLVALTELDEQGAAPLARLVRAGLRALGISHVPRGPVEGTRQNPAGLTQRQLQVLRLLGRNLTNAEIGERLVVSTRTVDSHVAAVLAKLGVGCRRDAATRAADLGVLDTKVG